MAELPDEVRRLLDGPNFGHFATVTRDGSPHSVAVWLGREGDRIVFFTKRGSQKARHLDRDPRVAISITDFEKPHRGANIRGRVVDQMSQTYTGGPFPVRGSNGVLFVIEPEKDGYRELPF